MIDNYYVIFVLCTYYVRNISIIFFINTYFRTQLLSSPSSPVPPTIQETSLHSNFGWKLTRIPERIWGNKKNTAAYKVNNFQYFKID